MNKNFLKISLLLFFTTLMVSSIYGAYIPEASMKIFAVTNNNVAMDATLHIEIKPGSGRIFSTIDTTIGSLTQESEKNAVVAATSVIGDDTRTKFDFYFDIQSSANTIDGPSAGAAIALLLVNMLEGIDLDNKVSITGSITSDGYIGDVGGVFPKTEKAHDVGIKLFMIPMGNRHQVITRKDGSTDLVDLVTYAYDEWGLKVVEVETLGDVLRYSKMAIEEIDVEDPIVKEEKKLFIPQSIKVSRAISPMRTLVNKYVEDANDIIESTEESINTSIIKDSSISQGLISLLNHTKESLKITEIYSNGNYLYSAANEAFLAKIYGTVISEIMDNPSILSRNSTIYNLKISELERDLGLAEKRLKLCSLEKLEWCVGARQRLTWAQNKIIDLKKANESLVMSQNIDKIMDYAYALGWLEIANDFLDFAIVSQGTNYVESSSFRYKAEIAIVDIENKLTISDESIIHDADLQRRLEAAKTNLTNGAYVSSLFDSATVRSILKTRQENSLDIFKEEIYKKKYDILHPLLRSTAGLNSEERVWSKQFFDHSIYYYNKYQDYENKEDARAITDLKTANSIINFALEYYDVETDVLYYYDNAGIEIIKEIIDHNENSTIITEIVDVDVVEDQDVNKTYYIYTKESNTKTTLLFIYIFALFIIVFILALFVDRTINKKARIQKKLVDLDEKLMDGKISNFTYKEMRAVYLRELRVIKDHEERRKSLKRPKLTKAKVTKMTATTDLTKLRRK